MAGMVIHYGPAPKDYRSLRWLETHPDNYVAFDERQRQWTFSYHHPLVWSAYVGLARVRCSLVGHEYSTLWEADKFVSDPKTRTNCLFCGHEIIEAPGGASQT